MRYKKSKLFHLVWLYNHCNLVYNDFGDSSIEKNAGRIFYIQKKTQQQLQKAIFKIYLKIVLYLGYLNMLTYFGE